MAPYEKTPETSADLPHNGDHFQSVRDRLAPDPTRLSAALKRINGSLTDSSHSFLEKFRNTPLVLRRVLTGLMLSSALASGSAYAAEAAHDAGKIFNSAEDITKHIKTLEQAAHDEHLAQKKGYTIISHSEAMLDGETVKKNNGQSIELGALAQPLLIANQNHSLQQLERSADAKDAKHNDMFRKEMLVYKLDSTQTKLKPLQHVHVKGWGTTQQEAILNALTEAAANAQMNVNVDIGTFSSQQTAAGVTKTQEYFYDYSTSDTEVALTGIQTAINHTDNSGGGFIVTLDAEASSL